MFCYVKKTVYLCTGFQESLHVNEIHKILDVLTPGTMV